MFVYEKKLQYPIRIANPNPKLAGLIISQYGGPYGRRVWFLSDKPSTQLPLRPGMTKGPNQAGSTLNNPFFNTGSAFILRDPISSAPGGRPPAPGRQWERRPQRRTRRFPRR